MADEPQTGNPTPNAPESPSVPPVKVCPTCSVQERTTAPFCPHCGKSYTRKRRRLTSKRARRRLLALIVILVVAGAGTGIALRAHHDDQVKARHRTELARRRAAADAEAAAVAERQRKAAEKQKLDRVMRGLIIRDMEKSITKDARTDAADGLIDGPILRTQCEPAPGGGGSQTAAPYTCIAVNKENGNGTLSGFRFTAIADLKKGSYTWHLGG